MNLRLGQEMKSADMHQFLSGGCRMGHDICSANVLAIGPQYRNNVPKNILLDSNGLSFCGIIQLSQSISPDNE